MNDETNDTIRQMAPTRRDAIKYGGVVVAGGLAGCVGGDSGDSDDSGSNGAATETETDSAAEDTETETETETGEASGSTDEPEEWTVTLAPAGEVTFDAVPENVFTVFPWYADMAAALGHGDSINSLWWAEGFDPIMQYFTAALDGVSVSWDGLSGEYGATKEQLFELDSDLHLVDPAWVTTLENWDRGDVDEIAENVAPWLGNQYSNLHSSPPAEWADQYEYYTLWELFERVAGLYREQARYDALAEVHADLLGRIEGNLPPEDERPTVGYVQLATDLSSVFVLRLNAPGYYNSHTRPLGAIDAFEDTEVAGEFAQVDFEALLEADPDVFLTLWGMTPTVDFEALRANLAEDSLGRELSAVQNDRVYTQGTRFQGPIMNLFQLEMTAKQLYPDRFGEWPGYVDGDPYPEFPEDEQLFDRGRVAEIITGDP